MKLWAQTDVCMVFDEINLQVKPLLVLKHIKEVSLDENPAAVRLTGDLGRLVLAEEYVLKMDGKGIPLLKIAEQDVNAGISVLSCHQLGPEALLVEVDDEHQNLLHSMLAEDGKEIVLHL